MAIRLLVLTSLLHHNVILLSQYQNLSTPYISTFTKDDYGGGTSNWSADADPRGSIYFANNSGLLEHNGIQWRLRPLPNKTIVRSVSVSESGRVYIGGQDEIGYFKPDSIGRLQYVSIRDEIPPEHLPLEDVWECISVEDRIYFRTTNKVLQYQENLGFEIIDPSRAVISIDKIAKEVYYTDLINGVININSSQILDLAEKRILGTQIVSMLPLSKRELLLLTEQDGGFILSGRDLRRIKSETFRILKESRINHACILDSNTIAIGTQFSGVIIIDAQGDIVDVYDSSSGLINNDVRYVYHDDFGNLWCCTVNGISKIPMSSKVKVIFPDKNNQGPVYDVASRKDLLLIGTNTGLYTSLLTQDNDVYQHKGFQIVRGSEGQVWGIDEVYDQLWVGHNEGPFLYKNGILQSQSQRPGAWKFVEAHDRHMYVGTYDGVDIYKYDGDRATFVKRLEGFEESSRILISVRKYELWVSHPYRGIFRITHDASFGQVNVESYGEGAGLPSSLLNYIFNIDGVPTVTSETGVYSYDRAANRFRYNTQYDIIDAAEHNVRRLLPHGYYIAEHQVGRLVIDRKTQDTLHHIYPELVDEFVGGFEQMRSLDERYLLVCGDEGVLMYDTNRSEQQEKEKVNIHSVALGDHQGTLLVDAYLSDPIDINLKPEQNELVIQYGSTNHNLFTKYAYRLLGSNREWSMWDSDTSKEFNNLSSGSYVFEVKSCNSYGVESEVASFAFTIHPPWYGSPTARVVYGLIVLAGLLMLYFIPRRQYQSQTKELQLAKEQSDAVVELLKSQQLEQEIKHKNAQLASSTLHLVQKNETLNKIRSEIEQIQKSIKDQDVKKELKKVISVLSDDERLEDDWENFSYHFDQVHSDFLKRLKQKYPDLTRKDQKMAAYLRMSLSTKEIAPLLGISVRGVEIGRYRLRKKLGLSSNISLRGFMGEF